MQILVHIICLRDLEALSHNLAFYRGYRRRYGRACGGPALGGDTLVQRNLPALLARDWWCQFAHALLPASLASLSTAAQGIIKPALAVPHGKLTLRALFAGNLNITSFTLR